MNRSSLLFACALLAGIAMLGGCASSGVASDGTTPDLRNAEVSTKTMGNGDRVDEYRVAGQVRMVRVTPTRGAPYFLYDRDGDGHMDDDNDGVSPVYWKVYSW
ncbi:MAG TPA: DUF2782 domain-containing protein [Stenotrophomonas sp.]|jgi:hypothetical protein